eukprot:10989010-Heterocapsa_arctica.AAC.1
MSGNYYYYHSLLPINYYLIRPKPGHQRSISKPPQICRVLRPRAITTGSATFNIMSHYAYVLYPYYYY